MPIILYKDLKGAASINTNDLDLQTGVPRIIIHWHFNPDIYKSSFFPTIRDWNSLKELLISASEVAEDSVTQYTSLVRARNHRSW